MMVLLLLHHGTVLRLVRLHTTLVIPVLIEHHFVLEVAIIMLPTHITAIAMSTKGRPTFIKASHWWSSSSLHVTTGVVSLMTAISTSSTLISELTSSVSLVLLSEGHATLIK